MPARERELFALLAARAGVVAAQVQGMEDALLERYAVDRSPYYDALEPSLSGTGERVDTYRFSYGFPAFRRDPRGAAATVLAMASPCGDAAVAAARRVLLAAERACVQQPIVGYAHDGAGQTRFKLYLMFRAGHDSAARSLTQQLVGAPGEPRQAGALHMVGLDVEERGLTTTKLYLEHATIELSGEYTAHPRTVHRALAIHSLSTPDDAALEPVAVDFSLRDGAPAWREVEQDLALECPSLVETFRDLDGRFGLQARRLSLFRGSPRKANLYYVLDPARA